jgi:hypothetical protein
MAISSKTRAGENKVYMLGILLYCSVIHMISNILQYWLYKIPLTLFDEASNKWFCGKSPEIMLIAIWAW